MAHDQSGLACSRWECHDGAVAVRTDDDVARRNRDGVAKALTTLTPLPRFWSPPLRLVLRLKSRAGPDKALQRLSFIHVAHWVVIDRFPGQRRGQRYSYLLFASNFNGSWRSYIEDFSTAIPRRMAILWGTSFGFPGAVPPRVFKRYIRRNDLELDHYYSAYPEASATQIASALRVAESFRRDVLPWADLDAAQFGSIWRAFLDRVQRDL
jgi:hypothetical protein